MSTVDFVNVLGAGAGFDSKTVVDSIVEAERAPEKAQIEARIEKTEAQISALGSATSSFKALQASAALLKDKSDFNSYTTSNSQPSALTVTANPSAQPGSHDITVTSVARKQMTNVVPNGASEFSSASQLLNSGTDFTVAIEVGNASTVTHSISVTTTTPQGIVDAINDAKIDVTARLIDKGTSGTEYVIQLVGQSGTDNQFTFTPSVNNLLSSNTPSGYAAANASLTVNGLSFTRPTNSISDIIEGVTLDLNGATSGAANISVNRDTTGLADSIKSFVDQFNETATNFDTLTNRQDGGALAGDSIFRQKFSDVKNILINSSSTPGSTIQRLSDIGISISRTGTFSVDDTTLTESISSNFDEIRLLFSADTEDQTEIGEASRGLAGDLSALITELTDSAGYLTTQTSLLQDRVAESNNDMTELEEKLSNLRERYTKQFASMNALIDELNNTRENLVNSFENLPFTNKD